MQPLTLTRQQLYVREGAGKEGLPTLIGSYLVISLADWSSGWISEVSPLFKDSLRLAREVTTFASVPRAPWLVSAY